jgi:phage FluMu protein Com
MDLAVGLYLAPKLPILIENNTLNVLRVVLYLFSVITLISIRYIRKRILLGRSLSPQSNQAVRNPIIGKYGTSTVAALALSVSVGIWGFILFIIGKNEVDLYLLMLTSAASVFFNRPKRDDILALLQQSEKERSSGGTLNVSDNCSISARSTSEIVTTASPLPAREGLRQPISPEKLKEKLDTVIRWHNNYLFLLIWVFITVFFLAATLPELLGLEDCRTFELWATGTGVMLFVIALFVGMVKYDAFLSRKQGLVCPHCGKTMYSGRGSCSEMQEGRCPKCRGAKEISTEDAASGKVRKSRTLKLDSSLFIISTLLLFLMIWEAQHLENTLGGLRLFYILFMTGLVIGVCIASYFVFSKRLGSDTIAKAYYFFFFVITCTLVTSTVGSRLNRALVSKHSYFETHIVESKSTSTWKGQRSWHIILRLPSGKKSFKVTKEFWEKVSEDEQLALELRKGFFGYPVVDYVLNKEGRGVTYK